MVCFKGTNQGVFRMQNVRIEVFTGAVPYFGECCDLEKLADVVEGGLFCGIGMIRYDIHEMDIVFSQRGKIQLESR